ncbi:hypothetical protein GIW56_09935 [Pseudomonas gessardii]|uniref:Uncharacterized protein n=1 Tax=Pseudomonas gessardii TaxID=78544 RepID=A0ABS9F441_9PSED|nr:hypothetical protein [Pseudomonas gessardii]MCF5107159.1 hypothetical protein [Pseudomonas gessardii]
MSHILIVRNARPHSVTESSVGQHPKPGWEFSHLAGRFLVEMIVGVLLEKCGWKGAQGRGFYIFHKLIDSC